MQILSEDSKPSSHELMHPYCVILEGERLSVLYTAELFAEEGTFISVMI